MQKRKKQLLGALGLLLVAALTVIASMKPIPGVEAAESRVNVTVEVKPGSGDEPGTGGEPSTSRAWGQITAPESGITTMLSSQMMVFRAKNVSYVTPCVTCSEKARTTTTVALEPIAADASGTIAEQSVAVDLASIAEGDANCVLAIYNGIVTQAQVGTVSSTRQLDAIEIKYRAAKLTMNGTNAQGNPLADVKMNNTAQSLLLQVYNANNEPVFIKADGTEEPLLVSAKEFTKNEDGLWSYSATLPMSQYGAPAGKYTLLVIAYGADGEKIVSTNTAEFDYDPVAPEVPGTGSWIGSMFGNLNIARIDYIITGVVAFVITVIVAIAMVLKRSKR